MPEFFILAAFFGVVMAGTSLFGYVVMRGRQAGGEGENTLTEVLRNIGVAAPVGKQEFDRLRRRLALAGYRQPSAAPIYSGIRIASAAVLGLLVLGLATFYTHSFYKAVLSALCGALFGFMLPDRVLNGRIRRRSEILRAGLPPALDLMVLNLEAGQSLDAALGEVTREIRGLYPELHEQLNLVQFDMLGGKSRADAFRNLAKRNEEIEIRRLAQVFLDADRFGTPLAPALRMHVHYLRLRMQQKAHETARRVGVKLIFPLFFLIFPAVLLVTLGPAVLQVVTQLTPMLNNIAP
jgi:tight adherence protein C